MHMRNKLKASLLSIWILIIAGCDQGITLGTRSFVDTLPLKTIPGANLPVDLNLSLILAINSDIINVDANRSFITSARLRNLQLVILDVSDRDAGEDGAEDSFDFLTGLAIRIRADFNGRTNEQLIASLPDGDPQFGTAARALDLTVLSVDVLDYLQARSGYQLVLELEGLVPPDNVVISGLARFRVGLGI